MGVLTIKNKEVWIKHILKGESFFVTHNNNIQIAYNNKPCKFEMEKGKVIKVEINGKVIYSTEEKNVRKDSKTYHNNSKDQGTKGNQNNNKSGQKKTARAPYNFIPLNDKVVKSEYEKWESIPGFNTYDNGKFTGFIDLEIETKTPIYIRDMKQIKDIDKEDYQPSTFFFKEKEYRIPGSSLRGLTRSMMEILSFGNFGFYDDKYLYYRGIVDKCKRFVEEYKKNMSTQDPSNKKSITYNFLAGYLMKEGFEYFIIPAKTGNDGKAYRQLKLKTSKEFEFKQDESTGEYRVYAGHMPGKENIWVINPPDYNTQKIPIPEKDIDSYINDENMFRDKKKDEDIDKKDGDLVRQLEIGNKIVPCFYVKWKDSKSCDRVAFGHTGYFRLSYKKSVKEHIPKILTDEKILDIPAAIFGDEKHHAGRVFFEDAFLSKEMNGENISMKEVTPQILSGPKPTTFQHYLEQPNGKDTCSEKLNHWNNVSNIRGNKMYWHKNVQKEKEFEKVNSKNNNEKVTTKMTPLKSGTKFNGRIRFENLSEIELGALLFALELPEKHYHKIGMAKPLGLGSIKITPELILTERNGKDNRYEKLFDNDNWYLAESNSNTQEFKNKFEAYIKEKTGNNVDTIWNIPRLRQLKIMLDWKNTEIPDWKDKTRYMNIGNKDENEFNARCVLPQPDEVIK